MYTERIISEGGHIYMTETDLDENGNTLEVRDYDKGGSLITKFVYFYSDVGNVEKWVEIKNGKVKFTFEYSINKDVKVINTYDENNSLIDSSPFDW